METVRVLVKAGANSHKKGGKDCKQTALSMTSCSEIREILLEALGKDHHEIGGGLEGGTVTKEDHQNDAEEITKKPYSPSDEEIKVCMGIVVIDRYSLV